MGINITQLHSQVIKPVCDKFPYAGQNPEELLILTCCQESASGQYLHQLGKGPACGIFQMEPYTHDLLWKNFLLNEHNPKPELVEAVRWFELEGLYDDNNAQEMCGNLYYAAAMCRVHYLSIPHAVPKHDNVVELATYYKKWYNTKFGAATVQQAVDNYKRFTGVA